MFHSVSHNDPKEKYKHPKPFNRKSVLLLFLPFKVTSCKNMLSLIDWDRSTVNAYVETAVLLLLFFNIFWINSLQVILFLSMKNGYLSMKTLSVWVERLHNFRCQQVCGYVHPNVSRNILATDISQACYSLLEERGWVSHSLLRAANILSIFCSCQSSINRW